MGLQGQAAVLLEQGPEGRRPHRRRLQQRLARRQALSRRFSTARPCSPSCPACAELPHLPAVAHAVYSPEAQRQGPGRQFLYQDADGRRLTLYVRTECADNHEPGFRFARKGDIKVFYWIDGLFGYALSGAQDRGEMARVADAVYGALDSATKRQ